MDIVDVLTNPGFIVGYSFILSIGLVERWIELFKWNYGVCRPLNKKWKQHSVYKNGAILYTANPGKHMIVNHPELTKLSKDEQLKTHAIISFSIILMLLACLVSATLHSTEEANLYVKIGFPGILLGLPSLYLTSQLLNKLKGYINEFNKGSKKQ